MSVTLQIRRQTTDANLPAANELLEGELLYIEQNKELYIGASNTDSDVVPLTIRPSFLTFKDDGASDKIVLTADTGSYTINSDNLQNNNVFTYTLPSGLPSEKKLLQSDANGNFSYGDVSLSNLENIGNVDPKMTADVLDEDQMLQYDSNTSKWVGKDIVNDLLSSLLLDAESDQTFENLSLLGNLTVKGGSVQLNSINLAVRDKLIGIGIGVGGASEIGTATMDTGVVSIETSSSFSSGDSVFVGDSPNIPTGFYTLSDSAGGGYTFTVPNSTATESTPFDVSIVLPSTDDQVDGSGLFFPGDTEKSLIWKDGVETKTLNASPSDDTEITPAQAQLEGWFLDINFENGVSTDLAESVIADGTSIYRPTDHFELKGGDLKVSGNKILFNESEEIVDNTDKKIKNLKVTTSQLTGVFDGGTYT